VKTSGTRRSLRRWRRSGSSSPRLPPSFKVPARTGAASLRAIVALRHSVRPWLCGFTIALRSAHIPHIPGSVGCARGCTHSNLEDGARCDPWPHRVQTTGMPESRLVVRHRIANAHVVTGWPVTGDSGLSTFLSFFCFQH
jgi:hypothetical protein